MNSNVTSPQQARPTATELVKEFGDEYLSIQSLFRFCFVPGGRLSLLKDLTLDEEWGTNNFVLLKYLAVHVRLAIEQERYVWNGDQLVFAVGRLTTPTGSPIYAGLVPNSTPQDNPWVLNWVGERPNCAELPEPPDLGHWPPLRNDLEVVIALDLSSEERKLHLPVIDDIPPVAQLSAIAGSVHWALHRGLAVPQIHGGGRGYFIPVYLESREDVSEAPDVVVPVLAQGERLIVRTVLDPHVAYAPARSVVERCEQLPPWLLDSWDRAVEEAEERATLAAKEAASEAPDGDSDAAE